MTEPNALARELSHAWDAHNRGDIATGSAADLLAIVSDLEEADRATRLDEAQMQAIWTSVMAGAVADLSNRPVPATATARNRSGAVIDVISAKISQYAWVIVAGMVGGFIAGVSSRVMMRLAGVLTIERNRFMLTENDARVGRMTLDGTLTLGAIGAALGVCALLFYLLIRNRLPYAGWQRAATFAGILLLVFGYVVMDPTNPDYHRFGPAWLNIATFSSLYLIMGFCVVQVYEAGLRWNSRHVGTFATGKPGIVRLLISIVISVLGTFMLVPALFLGTGMLLIPLIAGAIWLVNKVIGDRTIGSLEMPVLVRQWGIWVIPGLVGFILTARGITGILLG